MNARMDTRVAERIEAIVRVAAAAILAAAVVFGMSRLTVSAVTIGAASASALLVALFILRSIGPSEHQMSLAPFEPAELIVEERDELLLTEADRVDQVEQGVDDVLLLDDVLTEFGNDSRVVRLFDASAMPSPGELKARIDRHLNQAHSQNASADASEALHDALAELRRSLR